MWVVKQLSTCDHVLANDSSVAEADLCVFCAYMVSEWFTEIIACAH